jgi:rhodanese-related sulfurtransferase
MSRQPNEINVGELNGMLAARSVLLVDVRETHEYEYEHVPGALLMPLSFLDPDLFPRLTEKRVVVMCAVGKRSLAAAKQLAGAGHDPVLSVVGGLNAWRDAGYETEGARFEEGDYTI